MAKIGNLQVDTINLDYISAYASGQNSVIAPNPAAKPVQLYWYTAVQASARSRGSGSQLQFQIVVKRNRGGIVYYGRSQTISNTAVSFLLNGAALDWSAQAGDTYSFETSYQLVQGLGSASFNGKRIAAIWVEK